MGRKKKEIIDLGEWKTPKSWDDITLKKFQELERFYDDKDDDFDLRNVIHIMCGKSVDEVNQLPVDFMEKIMNEMDFLYSPISEEEPTNIIEIDGEKYIINFMEKLKVGEYVDVDTVIKSDKYDYASMLGIICRKEGEIYDSRFIAEEFDKRKVMFENVPITKVIPIVKFFFRLWLISTMPTLLSSKVEEELDHIQQNIETSIRNGDSSAHSMRSAMKTLRKLRKSIKNI